MSIFQHPVEEDLEELKKLENSSGEIVWKTIQELFEKNSALYLLDEPTNHLDKDKVAQLSKEIRNSPNTFIITSHDKEFLKKTVNKIWHIESKKVTVYKGDFEDFIIKKAQDDFDIEQQYNKIIRTVQRLRSNDTKRQDKFSSMRKQGKADPIKFFRKKNKFLHQNKVYKKRVNRLIDEELPKLPLKKQELVLDFINSPFIDNSLIRVTDLTKKIRNHRLFTNLSFDILPNEKILLSGPNGSGKTTLLKIISGFEKDFTGKIETSPSLNMRYFTQENYDDLNYENTVRDEIVKLIVSEQLKSVGEITPEILAKAFKNHNIHDDQILEHLIQLDFGKANLDQLVNSLSEGEKLKLRIAKLLLFEPNLLILDEPTNHLDLRNKKSIIKAINNFKGALIVATHDIELIEFIDWDFKIEL